MKVVVIGGTGLIGSKLVEQLGGRGHDAVAAAPNTGVNTITGEGLAAALTGASVVVDVSNSPSLDEQAAMAFFQTSTRNLAAAEQAAAGQIEELRNQIADLAGELRQIDAAARPQDAGRRE